MRQHCTDDTGAEHLVCPKPLGARMRYAVGKTVHGFLRPVTRTPYILQEYSSDTEVRWLLDCGRFPERLSIIANAERREYLEIPYDPRCMKWRPIA
jgi:hypothetical protein